MQNQPTQLETPSTAIAAHVVPFVAWLLLIAVTREPSAGAYALRSLLCLGLFLALRPWRWYRAPDLKHLPLALAAGVGVFAIWIAGESRLADSVPTLRDAYLRFGLMPPWSMPEPVTQSPYAPAVCGWPLTIVRILGSAFVIGVIEEYFWRGCLYRTLIQRDFLDIPLNRFHLWPFFVTAVAFGLEHQRWLVGIVAGCAYGLLLIRTRDIHATALAHATTNLLLGIYVVAGDHYAFWG